MGSVLGMALLAVQLSVPREQLGVAITAVRFSQTLGGAVFGAVLAREFAARVPDGVAGGAAGGVAAGSGGSSGIALLRTLTGPARRGVVDALVGAVDRVFACGAVIAALAVLITLFFREPPPPTAAPANGTQPSRSSSSRRPSASDTPA